MAGTMLLRITCDISNNRADLSLSYDTSDMFIRVELISIRVFKTYFTTFIF